jgi:hypothetical protein
MFKILLALHLLFAIFAIGPLAHAATTASRGVRRGDGVATASAARMLRIYSYASVLVILLGGALMSQKRRGRSVAEFGDTWIWLSLVLWVVGIAVVLGLIVPTLDRATQRIAAQESVVALTGRVAAGGGIVGAIFAAIVFLMTYKPGG